MPTLTSSGQITLNLKVFIHTIFIKWKVEKQPLISMVLRWFLVLKPLVPMVFNGFQMVANHRPGTEWNEPSLWSRPMLFRTPKTCPKMLKIYNIFMKYVCTLYLPALLLMPGANPSFCHKLERQYYFAQPFLT